MMMMHTHDGEKAGWFDPKKPSLDIPTIAHSLSHLCRYNGHVPHFYSVLEHSLRVHDLLSAYTPDVRMAALLHDAGEAIYGDITRPMQKILEEVAGGACAAYARAQSDLVRAVYDRYHISYPSQEVWDLVGVADDAVLSIELAAFFNTPFVKDPLFVWRERGRFIDIFNQLSARLRRS